MGSNANQVSCMMHALRDVNIARVGRVASHTWSRASRSIVWHFASCHSGDFVSHLDPRFFRIQRSSLGSIHCLSTVCTTKSSSGRFTAYGDVK